MERLLPVQRGGDRLDSDNMLVWPARPGHEDEVAPGGSGLRVHDARARLWNLTRHVGQVVVSNRVRICESSRGP